MPIIPVLSIRKRLEAFMDRFRSIDLRLRFFPRVVYSWMLRR